MGKNKKNRSKSRSKSAVGGRTTTGRTENDDLGKDANLTTKKEDDVSAFEGVMPSISTDTDGTNAAAGMMQQLL